MEKGKESAARKDSGGKRSLSFPLICMLYNSSDSDKLKHDGKQSVHRLHILHAFRFVV